METLRELTLFRFFLPFLTLSMYFVENGPVIVWVGNRNQNLVLFLIVSWPQLKGCNRCGTFHLHILSQTCFTLLFFFLGFYHGFVCVYLFCVYANFQRPTLPAGIVRLVGERASYPEQEIVVTTIACQKDLFVLVFYV